MSLILAVVISLAILPGTAHEEEMEFKELPVMNVNVYMMGRDKVDEDITVKIFENIENLNKAFQGEITFVFDELFMDPNHAFLPDLYQSYRHNAGEASLQPIIKDIEKTGGINIFLFDTYNEPGKNVALMGFTPMLSARQNNYATSAPQFDRILMAYDGLEDSKTLVHEMGHFLGLKHPWELTILQKISLGMRSAHDEDNNHMSYGSQNQFTQQQLRNMRKYALDYRQYLMDSVVRVYARA